jgi:hypothetical protein
MLINPFLTTNLTMTSLVIIPVNNSYPGAPQHL